jgi:hypothetical protein
MKYTRLLVALLADLCDASALDGKMTKAHAPIFHDSQLEWLAK